MKKLRRALPCDKDQPCGRTPFAEFVDEDALADTDRNISMIRRCDPQLEFIYRLFSGMHIHTSGDSLSSDMRWQREYKRQIDITQLSQQVETYDIEVDWHALGRIALDCGITIKEGDIVPLPLFRFRRFVQTEFECSSDPTVFFSHRTFNQRLAAMLATYGLTAWNKSLNQEELKTWYEARWMPVFRFGGNYREDETTHLIGEQQEIYEAVSGETSKFLQYVEDDEQMRLRKRYLDDLYRLKENYPVLTYVRAKTEGCTILRFRICRYQTRVARSEYGREVNTPSSSWYKRALLAFCGATLVEYSYQWLRDSTFLKIVFPKDCRSAHACTVGGMLESSDAEFSDGVLFSSVHREHGSPDGSDAYLRCYVFPKFRATVRFLVPELLEIMFLTLVALIWGFIPWSGVSAHVPASLFLTVGITQLGAAFLAGDINESPFLTNALKTPRTTMILASILHCVLLTVTLIDTDATAKTLSIDSGVGSFERIMVTIVYAMSGLSVFVMVAWAAIYLFWRISDRPARTPH